MRMSNVWFECVKCGQPFSIQYDSSIAPAISSEVCACGGYAPRTTRGWIPGGSNTKRSRDQKKRAAKRYGGKRQAASGAMDHAKGDVRMKGVHRGECKFTRAQSYSLKLQDLLDIEKQASGDEKPFLEIEFQGVFPHKRYVVLPDWAFQALIGGNVADPNN